MEYNRNLENLLSNQKDYKIKNYNINNDLRKAQTLRSKDYK